MLSARTSWSVEDNWIVLSGLGDAMADLIASASDPDEKVRLAAVINIGRRAVADTTDKRPLPVLLERLADKSSPVRLVASAVVGIPALVDATVDPCYRNRLIATLQVLADPKIEPTQVNRDKAAASLKTLLELGMLAPDFLPIAEKCGIVRPGPPIDIGPFVDPAAPPAASGLSRGEKVAIGVAAASVLGLVAYAILGGRKTPKRRRRRISSDLGSSPLGMGRKLYHGTSKADWAPHAGACLTESHTGAYRYAKWRTGNKGEFHVVTVEVDDDDLVAEDRTEEVDRDSQSWPGDTNKDRARLAAEGLDVVTYGDEDEGGRELDCYRLVSPAAVAAASVVDVETWDQDDDD